MGKNQTHKQLQRSKHGGGGGGGGPEDQDPRYAGHDASFHTAEWHAARLAALTMERPRCAAAAAAALSALLFACSQALTAAATPAPPQLGRLEEAAG